MKDAWGNETTPEALYKSLRAKDADTLMEEMEELIANGDPEDELLLAYDKILDEKDPVIPKYGSMEDLRRLKYRLGEPFEAGDLTPELPKVTSVVAAPEKARTRRRLGWKRPVLIAGILVALLALAAGASKVPFFQMVWNWGEGSLEITPQEAGSIVLEQASSEGFYSVQEALDHYEVLDDVAPQWVPYGFALKSLAVLYPDEEPIISAQYRSGEKVINVRIQIKMLYNQGSERNEDPEAKDYQVNGIIYKMTDNFDQAVATWETERCLCRMGGDVSTEDLKKMIDSMVRE